MFVCFFSKFHVVAAIGHTQFNELGESVNPPLSAVTAGREERSEINSTWFEFNISHSSQRGTRQDFRAEQQNHMAYPTKNKTKFSWHASEKVRSDPLEKTNSVHFMVQ